MALQELLGDIIIHFNRWGRSPNAYSVMVPFLHREAMREATLYKTNQLDGAWSAVLAGRLFRRPVIVRAGYPWYRNHVEQFGPGLKAGLIKRMERFSLRRSTAVFLTTDAMKQDLVTAHHLSAHRVHVVPNFVDTELFRPDPGISREGRKILFVGRLSPVKNVDVLIRSVSAIPGTSLEIIGDGDDWPSLERLADEMGTAVEFRGRKSTGEVAAAMAGADVFALPSTYEGHPKALLEAMACGAAVVGSDVRGINGVIQHEETGLLCLPETESLRQALVRLLEDQELRSRLGRNARQYVLDHFALNRVVQLEIGLLRRINDGDHDEL